MKRLLIGLALASSAFAVDGTVHNATKDKPQAGATVSVFHVTSNGPQMVTSTKSGADGHFELDAPPAGGPRLVQAVFEGVTYNRMIPPGQPDTGLTVDVFDASPKPGGSNVQTHMMLLEPQSGRLNVSESFVFTNPGKVTWNDPEHGTLRFYLPPGTGGKVDINVIAPNSVPIRRAADPTSEANVFKLDFPIKPGESRVDLSYAMPFESPGVFATKVLFRDPDTKVLAPQGVTLKAADLANLGEEPQSKAQIFDAKGAALRIEVAGQGMLRRAGNDSSGDNAAADSSSGNDEGNQISQLMPQLYGKADPAGGFQAAASGVKWLVAVVFGLLALAFTWLYRRPSPGDSHDGPR